MSSKRIYEIDGSRFSTLEEFYDEVSRVVIPKVYWGRNLNAFNDILRGGFGTPVEGFILVWKNSDLSREKLGYLETARQLRSSLMKCHPTAMQDLENDLELAEKQEGSTIFDWLVEIIQDHGKNGEQAEDKVELRLL